MELSSWRLSFHHMCLFISVVCKLCFDNSKAISNFKIWILFFLLELGLYFIPQILFVFAPPPALRYVFKYYFIKSCNLSIYTFLAIKLIYLYIMFFVWINCSVLYISHILNALGSHVSHYVIFERIYPRLLAIDFYNIFQVFDFFVVLLYINCKSVK